MAAAFNRVGVCEPRSLFSRLGLLVSAAQSAPLGSWQRGLVEEARGEKIKSFEKIVSIKTEMKVLFSKLYFSESPKFAGWLGSAV